MKTKFLLGALGLTAAFAACTNEDVIETNVSNSALEGRKVVDLELVNGVESRLAFNEAGKVDWEADDKIGSILVDPNNQWEVESDAHLGNNRWDYVGKKFTTQGTTVEGAWMFYYPYSSAMSKNRGALQAYNKSLVNQEYDADGAKMYANDFRISPVYFVNAAEGNAKIDVELTSIYAYGNIKAALPQTAAGAKIGKVLVKFGAPMADSLTIDAAAVADVASMNYAYNTTKVTTQNPDGKTPETLLSSYKQWWNVDSTATSNAAATTAKYALQDWVSGDVKDYKKFTDISNTSKNINYILIDCANAPALADTMFSTRVLLPTGVIENDINLYFYTDKGVYNAIVKADADNKLYFKRGLTADLHNVNRVADTETIKQKTYLKTNVADATTSPIVETADLVNLIKQFKATTANAGKMNVTNQLMGTVVLNDAVAEAMAGNAELKTITVADINITCANAQTIEKLVATGNVTIKAGSNITIGGAWSVAGTTTIETGANVTVAKNCGNDSSVTLVMGSLTINNKVLYTSGINSKGTLTLGNEASNKVAQKISAYLNNIESGSFTINVPVEKIGSQTAKLGSDDDDDALTVTVNQNWTGNLPEVLKNATITNNAVLKVATNGGTITNNYDLEVTTNNGTINNNVSVITTNGKVKVGTNSATGVINTVADSQTDITTRNYGIIYYAENAFINGSDAAIHGSHLYKNNIVYKVAADMTAAELASKIQQTKVTAIEIENAKLTVEEGVEDLKALLNLKNISMKGSAEVIANDTLTLVSCPVYVSGTNNVVSGTAPVSFVVGGVYNEVPHSYCMVKLLEGAQLEIKTVINGVKNFTLDKNAKVIARTNVYGPQTKEETIELGQDASWLGTEYEQK